MLFNFEQHSYIERTVYVKQNLVILYPYKFSSLIHQQFHYVSEPLFSISLFDRYCACYLPATKIRYIFLFERFILVYLVCKFLRPLFSALNNVAEVE